LDVINNVSWHPKKMNNVWMFKVMLVTSNDFQQFMLMLAMNSNACATIAKPLDMNPLKHIFSISKVRTYSFLEYFKFVKIVMVQVLGSMEDEPIFIYLAFANPSHVIDSLPT